MKVTDAVKKIALGVLGALLGSLGVSGLLGLLIQKETMPISVTAIVAAVIVYVSVLLACFVTVRALPKGKLLITLVIAAVYVLLQLLIGGMLIPVTEISVSWKVVLPFAAAVIAGIWSSAGRGHKRNRRTPSF